MFYARPVFISSTFVDMHAERDHLRSRVFPELEERLRQRGGFLEWVDLRVGVATASEQDENVRELHVLRVCLDEIRRCRPFLIVLLGDRYGWVPPEQRMKAAAEEARKGFSAQVAGRSVTDLEIDFGVLYNEEQQARSFFYFRDPLPYDAMSPSTAALYSENHTTGTDAADRVARLASLKQRIVTQLPDRVRRYSAGWDDTQQSVTGLEQWGRTVLEDIWSELEADLPERMIAASWQQVETDALQDFIADRARDFVGRTQLIADLKDFSYAPQPSADRWGVCITGEPGAGKSALFTELVRHLKGANALILAHAAGASPQAVSVDLMLRRWIGELAIHLGSEIGLADDASPEAIWNAFASLLERAAAETRVVVLVDALDQLERGATASNVTWLPRLWPSNARFVATSTPAVVADDGWIDRAGITVTPLPPIDVGDARAIIASICRRYHREFETEVVEALLAKRTADGFAWQNPLWLVVAVEQLNLLDAADFARAQRDYAGDPAARLRDMMVSLVATFPPDVAGLYRTTFVRAEEEFGADLTRGFLHLIAISRGGWRESDFRVMLPRVSGRLWDELQFAQLRRYFRGQIQKRGSFDRWTFNHLQMRLAVLQNMKESGADEAGLHTVVVDRLLSCQTDDPLRVSEVMLHLIAEADWARVAGYYGNENLSLAEASSANRHLIDALRSSSANAAVDTIDRMIQASRLPAPASGGVARTVIYRLLYELDPIACKCVSSTILVALSRHIIAAAQQLVDEDPRNEDRNYDLASAWAMRGQASSSMAVHDEAVEAFQKSIQILEPYLSGDGPPSDGATLMIATTNPALVYAAWRVFLAMGSIFREAGFSDRAVSANSTARRLAEQLIKANAENVHHQHALAMSCAALASSYFDRSVLTDAAACFESARTAYDAALQMETGDPGLLAGRTKVAAGLAMIAGATGRVADQVEQLLDVKASYQRLVRADPANALLQSSLATTHERLGDIYKRLKRLAEAAPEYQQEQRIFERLSKADPHNAEWRRGVAICHQRMGDVATLLDDLDRAMSEYSAELAMINELGRQNPQSIRYAEDFCAALANVGKVCSLKDRFDEGLQYQLRALAIQKELSEADPLNLTKKARLAEHYGTTGAAYLGTRQTTDALAAYESRISIMRTLVQADQGNVIWRRALATACDYIADVWASQNEPGKAYTSLHESFEITRAMSDLNDMSQLIEVTGKAYKLVDSCRSAPANIRVYAFGLFCELLRRGQVLEPTNPAWARDLALTTQAMAELRG